MLSEPFIFKNTFINVFKQEFAEYALLPNFVCEILIIMVELTNNLRKLVASLDNARARRDNGLFVAEGTKCVLDTLHNFHAVIYLPHRHGLSVIMPKSAPWSR